MLTLWVHSVATVGTLHCQYHKKWAMKKIIFPISFVVVVVVIIILSTHIKRGKLEKKRLRLFTVIFHLNSVWKWIQSAKTPTKVDQNILCTSMPMPTFCLGFSFFMNGRWLWWCYYDDDVGELPADQDLRKFHIYIWNACDSGKISIQKQQMITFAFSWITEIVIVGLIFDCRYRLLLSLYTKQYFCWHVSLALNPTVDNIFIAYKHFELMPNISQTCEHHSMYCNQSWFFVFQSKSFWD